MIKKWFNIITQKIYNKQFALCILLVLFCCLYLTSPSYADTCPSMAVLKERYQGDCFPCKIVNVLLSSFMRAAGQVYDVSKAAGNKLLLLGSALWIAFWALKKMISFARVEPADMAKELLNFLGKVLIAYCFVNAGIGTLVSYAINPILGAGAEFGTALLLETEDFDTSSKPIEDNQYQGPTEIVSASVMNKILKLSEGVSNEVATNYIVGSGLTCFAFQQGFSLLGISVPDIWMWLCGAAIWCVGFMLTLAVCYYLIDIPFKIGFAVMALPVVIGLWPFKITEDKLKSIIMIAVNAAGTFLFLALSSSYAIRLMMEAFSSEGELPYEGKTYSGKEALFKAFETDNVEYVEGLFDLTGPGLLIVLFCYIYGFKMISEITTKYPDKFFSGSMTAAAGNPLHQMATAATGWVGSKIAAPFKTAVDIAAYQAGKAATTAVKATANVAGAVVKRGAGAVTRAAGRSIAKASSSAVNKQRSLKTAADSLDRQNSLNNAGLGTKIGGKLGKLQASMGLKMAESVNKLGQKMEKSGDNMVQSSKDPFKRIVQAAKAGGKEWKDAAVDLGQSLAEVGSSVTPNKAVEAMQNNPNLQKISNTVMQNKQNMRQQGDLSFKRSVVKFKQSGGQLVNRFVNAGNAVKTTFSKDGKIAQKVASFKGKSFSEIRKDIGSAIAKPFVEAHAKTREDVLRSKENYANRISGFGSTFKNKAQLSQAELIELLKKLYPDQFAEDFLNQYADLKETTKGLKNTITDETGIQGTKGAAASMATGTALGLAIAKNLGKNFQHGIDYVKEGEINSIGTAIGSGVIRPAAALTMALADSASDTLESTYRLSEQSLLTGISLAQTVASPLKTVGRSLTYGAFAIGDAGMAVGSVGLNGVGLATGVLNVGYQYSKYVTRPVLGVPLQGAGALVGLAAKTVDNTLYAGYKSVETLAMAGKTLGLGANVLYHGLKDHTIAGQAISKTFKAGSKTLALAGKTLKLGRNIIRAAAGENIGIGDDRGEKQKDKNNSILNNRNQQYQDKEQDREELEKAARLKEQEEQEKLAQERERKEQERKERERKEKEEKEEKERKDWLLEKIGNFDISFGNSDNDWYLIDLASTASQIKTADNKYIREVSDRISEIPPKIFEDKVYGYYGLIDKGEIGLHEALRVKKFAQDYLAQNMDPDHYNELIQETDRIISQNRKDLNIGVTFEKDGKEVLISKDRDIVDNYTPSEFTSQLGIENFVGVDVQITGKDQVSRFKLTDDIGGCELTISSKDSNDIKDTTIYSYHDGNYYKSVGYSHEEIVPMGSSEYDSVKSEIEKAQHEAIGVFGEFERGMHDKAIVDSIWGSQGVKEKQRINREYDQMKKENQEKYDQMQKKHQETIDRIRNGENVD